MKALLFIGTSDNTQPPVQNGIPESCFCSDKWPTLCWVTLELEKEWAVFVGLIHFDGKRTEVTYISYW